MSLLSANLQAFLAVAKCRSVHGAASQLCLTQTAVTQRLRKLEAHLGVSTFVRTRRGMLLTPEGAALLRYCQGVNDLESNALPLILGQKRAVEVTISGATSFMSARVIPACVSVMHAFPSLYLRFDIEDGDRLSKLKSGEVELALLPQEQLAREMHTKALAPEEYVLVAPAKWATRSLKAIVTEEVIIDFNPVDQMTFNYLRQVGLFDHARHERHFVNRTESVAALVASGCGYSVLTREFAEPFVARGELCMLNQGEVYSHQLSLAWYERPEMPAYLAALVAAIG